MSEAKQAKWYVAHTYSGHENKVKFNIEATVVTRNMQDVIQEVVVPMHTVEEIKDGKRTKSQKKIFPGYVLVKMIMTDESWYVVRNTRGVTGFVGPASKPVSLSAQELKSLGIAETVKKINVQPGDEVNVLSGAFAGFSGIVEMIDEDKQKITVNISMFGRETPVELDWAQVERIV